MNVIPEGIKRDYKTFISAFIKALNSPNDLMIYYRRKNIKSLKESGGSLQVATSLAEQSILAIEETKLKN